MKRSLVDAGTILRVRSPPVFILDERGPEWIGRALERSQFVRDATVVPKNTIVVIFFLEAQILETVGLGYPPAIRRDEPVLVKIRPFQKIVEIDAGKIDDARVVTATGGTALTREL
jgi:hypothetical protein